MASSDNTRVRGVKTNVMMTPKCELDEKGCLSLQSILESFSAPIGEEHAWALCYQCAKIGQIILNDGSDRNLCFLVNHTEQLLIHRDGQVHKDTFLLPAHANPRRKGISRTKCGSESKLISKLTIVIFKALDFGLEEDEERTLSKPLESLLDDMSSADECGERPETDDEGIERDSGDSDDDRNGTRGFNFDCILDRCTERLQQNSGHHSSCHGISSSSSNSLIVNSGGGGCGCSSSNPTTTAADSHYKAVCRALVAEALELSTFLQKVSQGSQEHGTGSSFGLSYALLQQDPDLGKLHLADWARLWVQVIRELRDGVKLKKVDSSYPHDCSRGPPIEYELTPYEILMDDIRSRRYKLNKVMVDGSLPRRIKKDAHAIILEFIRSRPPLKKAADRVLAPLPHRSLGPRETLMESIRKEHNLRPTARSRRKESVRSRGKRISSSDMTEISSFSNNKSSHPNTPTSYPSANRTQTPQSEQPQRRLIKADFDLLYSLDTKDDDDEYLEDSPKGNGTCFYGHICPEGTQSTPVSPWKKPNDGGPPSSPNTTYRTDIIFMLVTEAFEDGETTGVDIRRRHSICNPTVRDEHGSTLITFPFEYTNSKNIFSSLNGPSVSPILHRRKAKLPHSVSKSSLQEEFFQSNHWQTAIECLSLNLEEVVHIRNVLTKAELEGLPVDCSLKEDVEKGKVCFLCLKTRFSLFGPWGSSCKLCKRTVCAKCCSKMRIPTEHFAKVPVSTLSPTISPREEEKEFSCGSKTPTPRTGSLTPTKMASGRKNSVGSAPTSPNMSLSRKSVGTDSDSGQRSISPGLLEAEERDRFSPDHHSGPYSLPTVTSISLGLMAFKRKNFGRGKDDDKTERLKGVLMVVCHDCKAMVCQIIRSSRAKKAGAYKSNLTLDLPSMNQ